MASLVTGSTTQRRRLRRLIPDQPPATSGKVRAARTGPHPLYIATASAWFGLLTGPAELGLVVAQKHLRDGTPGFFQLNRQIVWMIPLFHLILFCAIGLLLSLLAATWPKFSTRRAGFFLGFVAVLSLALAVRSIHPIASLTLAAGLAFRASSLLEARCLKSRGLVLKSLPLAVVLFLALVGLSIGSEAWAEARSLANLPRAQAGAPNVVLIVLDTVSAQHMSLYGYPRETTPNLARLARRGVRFDHARATAPWTLPSHASMFTGQWPHQVSAGYHRPLDDRAPTLAEALRDRGYATGGFVANTLYASAETGLNRGFMHYEDHELAPSDVIHSAAFGQVVLEKVVSLTARPKATGDVTLPARPYKDSKQVRQDAMSWLTTQEQGGRPFFLFLNLFDAHTPYLLPDGCARHFGLAPKTRSDFASLNGFWEADKQRLTPHDVALARDSYDDCIAQMDEQVGRLIDDLDRRGTLRNTVLIITADHGEQFGEHGLFGHASSLYRGEVHVPLLIVAPDRVPSGATVREPVSLRNLPATVLDLLGERQTSRFPGRSLARHWDPSAPAVALGTDPVLSEVASPAKNHPNQGRSPVFRGSMSSLVVDGQVYIRNSDGHEELYDLEADPTESRNLAAEPASRPSLLSARAAMNEVLRPGVR